MLESRQSGRVLVPFEYTLFTSTHNLSVWELTNGQIDTNCL